ncbi:peptidoglycan-binding domain-containing protein [Acidisoma silvae]|uniref:Peptidoglycan-binding protein n=1 Tax=Acidisoma silvae TaxID=2802396 RepID=A0A963YW67_9PROT|nr:peptidoglycan-binding domain-containing protein [Acidisoma silvae]MCB8878254.1 peptidoglycan-binding protein [Acidisoma silvae]
MNFGLAVRSNCGIALAQSPNSSAPPPPDAPASAASCVAQAYEQQRSAWDARLTGDATEEVARSLDGQAALQKQLQLLGYLPASATIDAVFGTGTRAAIMAWQIARGKVPTGLLGNDDAVALMADTNPSPGTTQNQPPAAPQAILAPAQPSQPSAPPPKPATAPGIPAEQTGSGPDDWKVLVAQASAQGVTVSYDSTKQPCIVALSMAPDTIKALTNQFIAAAAADQNQQASWHDHNTTVGMMLFQAEFSAPVVKRFYEDFSAADQCHFEMATSGYDDFGQPSLKDLYSFDLNRAIFSRINWEHFIPTNITRVSLKFAVDPDVQAKITKEGGH